MHTLRSQVFTVTSPVENVLEQGKPPGQGGEGRARYAHANCSRDTNAPAARYSFQSHTLTHLVMRLTD